MEQKKGNDMETEGKQVLQEFDLSYYIGEIILVTIYPLR